MPDMQVSSNFVKPHFIEALGEEGLTSVEIAQALGARHDNVRRHILTLEKLDQGFTQKRGKPLDQGGRPVEVLLVPTIEAKMVVAQYRNKVGLGYLRFLIQCEAAIPILLQRLVDLEESNAFLRNENQELAGKVPKAKLPKKPSHRYVETITIHQSLFDEGGLPLMSIVTKKEKKRRDLLTPAELSAANALFSSKVYTGIKAALKNHLEDFNSKLQAELGIKFNMADTLIKTLLGNT